MRRIILPLIFGVIGTAILVSLGLWQLQRKEWKEGILDAIAARMEAAPVALPAVPDPEADLYLPVRVEGMFVEPDLRILASHRDLGPIYRLISAFETEDGRRVLIDRGVIRTNAEPADVTGVGAVVVGNLHWPDEVDKYTPAPDLDKDIWFARDLPLMAETLSAEDLLIVAREVEGVEMVATPLAVGTEGIPNSHFGYAIQWFGFAAVWVGMTGLFVWRIRRQAKKDS